jgi:hypothetical protein
MCRRFRILCLFHLHILQHSQTYSSFIPIRLWRWNIQSVPKRRNIKFRRRVITKEKASNIQNTAEVWNQEYVTSIGRKLQYILHTYPPIKMEQSVPKRRNIKFRHRGITKKHIIEESSSCPGRSLPPGKTLPHFTGGWVGPRVGLDGCGKSLPNGSWFPDRPARSQSLYRLRYPAVRNKIHSLKHSNTNWTGYTLLRNCLLNHVIAGKTEEMGRWERRRKQLL